MEAAVGMQTRDLILIFVRKHLEIVTRHRFRELTGIARNTPLRLLHAIYKRHVVTAIRGVLVKLEIARAVRDETLKFELPGRSTDSR